jgi:hypothetical protein
MSSQVLALRVGGTIFGLMALAQLARLVVFHRLAVVGLVVMVGGHQSSIWPSVIAVIILGGLAIWQWKVSYTTEK